MTTSFITRLFSLIALASCLLTAQPPAPTSNPKPISKNGLTHALQIGGLSEKELVEQVTRRGVDFNLTAETETDLRHAGADSALIDAVRANYRPSGSESGGGSSESALAALDTPDSAPRPARTTSSSSSHPLNLRDVHKLYIEKMPNGLDGYLRAAISRKLGSYFTIVLDRPEADAILVGTDPRSPGAVSIVDPSGKVVLWSGSANDKEKVYLNFKHGGQRELAEKLAGQLKKYLD